MGNSTSKMEVMVSQNYFKSVYQGKKVFLTGHTGFKGTWMLSWLHLLGAEVKGYALIPNDMRDLYHVMQGDTLCDSVIADIRERTTLEKAILDFQPDFIFHLAAQPLVRLSYEIPAETFEINTIGTVNVLDAVRKLQKQCSVVLITTDKVYENQEWHYPYREGDRLGGYDPYSASKAAAEIVIQAYRRSFFNSKEYLTHRKAIGVARAGNVIGGGDWSKDRIIPDIVNALVQNQVITVRNPDAVRPWQHVLEPIAGYLLLGAKLVETPLLYSEAWNFGPQMEDNLTVKELVQYGIQIYGQGKFHTPVELKAPHEAKLLKLDISKTVNVLGWKPRLNAKSAIQMTLDWYKTPMAQKKAFTLNQILNFIS